MEFVIGNKPDLFHLLHSPHSDPSDQAYIEFLRDKREEAISEGKRVVPESPCVVTIGPSFPSPLPLPFSGAQIYIGRRGNHYWTNVQLNLICLDHSHNGDISKSEALEKNYVLGSIPFFKGGSLALQESYGRCWRAQNSFGSGYIYTSPDDEEAAISIVSQAAPPLFVRDFYLGCAGTRPRVLKRNDPDSFFNSLGELERAVGIFVAGTVKNFRESLPVNSMPLPKTVVLTI